MGVQIEDLKQMAVGLKAIGADKGRAVEIIKDAYAACNDGEELSVVTLKEAVDPVYEEKGKED